MNYKKYCNQHLKYKKLILCLLFIILAIISTFFGHSTVFAENVNNEEFESGLSQVVDDIVDGIDLNELEFVLNDLDSIDLFNGSIKDKILEILKGEYFTNYTSIFSGIISIFFVDLKEYLPFLFSILAIGILSNLMKEFGSDKGSTKDIVHFVCFSFMTIVILVVFKDVLGVTSKTINIILKQIKIIFPILIVLLSSIGSFSAISIYNPLVAVLTTIVTFVFDKLLYPMFIILFVFTIIGSLTETVKIDKFKGFLSSSFKWIVGIVFTLFTGFLSVQGISAGRYDSVSIKATKFAVKSYIPIIGSYISEGMDFVVLGSVLVKNTIGLVGILIIFLSIIAPVVSILVLKLGLQLCSAILELSGSNRMSNFVGSCSKILIYPIVIILAIAFMYTITIALILCTANIF